jgi:hypothetical protein
MQKIIPRDKFDEIVRNSKLSDAKTASQAEMDSLYETFQQLIDVLPEGTLEGYESPVSLPILYRH